MISLEETRRFQLRYGLELSSEYNSALDQRTDALGVAADIRDRNFLGRGMSLGGGLRYEPDLRSARALFSVPTLRRRPIRTNLFLTGRGEEHQDEQLTARDDEVNLTIEQRWRVSRAVDTRGATAATGAMCGCRMPPERRPSASTGSWRR